jgi:[ribosomal protein S5]-alanine N-acetyltransferase
VSATPLRLVPLQRDGAPAEDVGALSIEAEKVCAATASLYESRGYEPPWLGYFAQRGDELVGVCSFTSPPRAGRVEIAYFTFPPFEGRGVATAMARALIEIARAADPSVLLTANTLAEDNASTSILRKIDFRLFGPVNHPEDGLIWEWHLEADA